MNLIKSRDNFCEIERAIIKNELNYKEIIEIIQNNLFICIISRKAKKLNNLKIKQWQLMQNLMTLNKLFRYIFIDNTK